MFAHIALRLAVVEALAPSDKVAAHAAGNAVASWPTLARHRVLDSQIEAVATTEDEVMTPIIGVFTDDSATEPQGDAQDALVEPRETVTLAFEVQVPVVSHDASGQPIVGTAETDALAEAFVNTICAQISAAIRRARMDGPLRHVLITIGKATSRAWSDADTMVRLSARRIEMTALIRPDEDLPSGQTGLGRLPAPLRDVALALPSGSYGRLAAERVASVIGDPAAFPALQDLRLAVNFIRSDGSAEPDPPDAGAEPPTGDGVARTTPAT